MLCHTYSYRYAEEILQHPFYQQAYNEILQICQNCPLPVYPGKSVNQPRLDVVQQIINTYFKIMFSPQNNWEHEPHVSPQNLEDTLRADFKKSFTYPLVNSVGEYPRITTQIEVEMGNIASSYRNYFKFQLSFSHQLSDIGIIILPCDSISRRIDSGVASFEKTVREIPSANLSITVPILVIGLDYSDDSLVDVRNFTTDMNIVKGASNQYLEQHLGLVDSIINRH